MKKDNYVYRELYLEKEYERIKEYVTNYFPSCKVFDIKPDVKDNPFVTKKICVTASTGILTVYEVIPYKLLIGLDEEKLNFWLKEIKMKLHKTLMDKIVEEYGKPGFDVIFEDHVIGEKFVYPKITVLNTWWDKK